MFAKYIPLLKGVLVVASFVAAVSCVGEPELETPQKPTLRTKIINTCDGAVSGRMVVYVDDSTANEWLASAEPTRATAACLGAAAEELCVEHIRPVFNLAVNGDVKRERGMHRWFVVEFTQECDVEVAARHLASISSVERVEYVKRVVRPEVNVVPCNEVPATRSEVSYPFDDPMLPLQWALNNRGDKTIFSTAVAGEDINAFKAWEYSAGHPDVVVAVVDEGIKYTHPDLAANMWTNQAELNGVEGVDDDANGYVDDIYGINTIDSNGDISWNNPRYDGDGTYIGDVGHGTHVAGIIAAVNNNGIGISSIAGGTGNGDGVRLMSIQMFRENDGAEHANVAAGIEYAADMGAAILQCSWGAPTIFDEVSRLERMYGVLFDGLSYFMDEGGANVMDGGVVFFSAGNESFRMAGSPGAHPMFVSVAAMAADGLPAYYTNYGYGCNIVAPGGDFEWVDGVRNPQGAILSTVPSETPDPYSNGRVCYDSDYGYMTGTSMACPYVSGVAALALSYAVDKGRHISNKQLIDIIYSSTTDVDSQLVGNKRGHTYNGEEWEIDLATYRKRLGIGKVDALYSVASVSDVHTVAATVGESVWLSLTEHLGNGDASIELRDYYIDNDTRARLGVEKVSISGNTLQLVCTKSGVGVVALRYLCGMDFPAPNETSDPYDKICGSIVDKEFIIVVRDNNDEGAWM